MTDNITMEITNSNNLASYNFDNIYCLDTGEFVLRVKIALPDESYIPFNLIKLFQNIKFHIHINYDIVKYIIDITNYRQIINSVLSSI